MKKTYIEPQLQEIRMNISGMVCVSGPVIDPQTTTEAGITTADSREADFFEDEDF